MKITRCCDALGARVEGLDLSKPLDAATVAQLKAAWVEHHVLVFPQQELSTAQHIAFSKNFGDLVKHPVADRELVVVTEATKSGWHSDITPMRLPPSFSLLYGRQTIEIEGVDSDTRFSNQTRAYATLSPGLRQFLENTRAVHRMGGPNVEKYTRRMGGPGSRTPGSPPIEALHPCVRLHPESGKPVLYVTGGFMDRFEGWTREESMPLIEQIVEHATKEENVYRHKWRKGDLVCWDNRAVLHRGPPNELFPKGAKRLMERINVTPATEQPPFYDHQQAKKAQGGVAGARL